MNCGNWPRRLLRYFRMITKFPSYSTFSASRIDISRNHKVSHTNSREFLPPSSQIESPPMTRKLLFFLALGLLPALVCSVHADDSAPQATIKQVEKIWDEAPHNAFTDLVRFKDAWYCVFREGQGHVSDDGALRVLKSTDGKSWQSVAKMTADDADLRDAKICVTPDGRLMLCGAGALHQPADVPLRLAHLTIGFGGSPGTTASPMAWGITQTAPAQRNFFGAKTDAPSSLWESNST